MNENAQPQPNTERIATGINGVDTIFSGGFMVGSVQLLVGRPGAGKTIFANQFAFHHAAQGHTAVYVTLLAESHARMLTNLARFSFFNPDLVSRKILYMSGHSVLEQSGLDGLLDLLTRTIRDNAASLLVIDSLNTAKEFAPTATAFKRFLLRLATSASLTACTTVLISLVSRSAEAEPERGTSDGIIRLDKRAYGARVVREITVEKMRATHYALGMHAIDIDERGIHVYPRLESLPTPQILHRAHHQRVEFGLMGLDAMLGGGVLEGSMTGLVGPSGTGKTLLGSSFLYSGVRKDERAVYLSLREAPEHVLQQAQAVGLHLQDALARGMLSALWFPTVETSLDGVAWQLFERIREQGVKRVFIDGIEGFRAMLVYPERLTRFFTALITRLASLGCTTVMAEGTPPSMQEHESIAVASADNVVVFTESRWFGRVHRFVTTQKVQAGPHDFTPRRFCVSSTGLSVDRRWYRLFSEDKL